MKTYNIFVILLFVVSIPYFFPKKEHYLPGKNTIKVKTGTPLGEMILSSFSSLVPVWEPRDPKSATDSGFFVHIPFHILALIVNISAAAKDSNILFDNITEFPSVLQNTLYSDKDQKPELSQISQKF